MVVALLGILFVVGAAFLQSVTFDARQIDAEVQTGQEQAAIDAISKGIYDVLDRGWLSVDGVPYRMSGPSLVECIEYVDPSDPSDGCIDINNNWWTGDDYKLSGPAYGELPYLHGIMAPLEPYRYYDPAESDPAAVPILPFAGYIERALKHEVATLNDFSYESGNPDDADPRLARINLNPDEAPRFMVDADGDGIPDSREFDLTAPDSPLRLPPSLEYALRESLNPPEAISGGIWLSVRAIPHGGMVDINWSHPELVYAVFPKEGGDFEVEGTLRKAWNEDGRPYNMYRPETDEAALRHRGGLPPRRLSESTLQRTFEFPLLGLHRRDVSNVRDEGTFDSHRWWFHDLNETGKDEEFPFWFTTFALAADRMGNDATVEDFEDYDRRHLITTYSTDNLFVRDGTWDDPGDVGTHGLGWVELMLRDPEDTDDPTDFGRWALDDHPFAETSDGGFEPLPDGNVCKGHMQISLPYLEISLLDDPAVDEDNNGIDSLQARLDPGMADETRKRAGMFVRTIQDAFLLMLRNVNSSIPAFGGAGSADGVRARIAASLTANLIDFADSDDTPTRIKVIEVNGRSKAPPEYVYGLERQPYITEVYTEVVGIQDPSGAPETEDAVADPSQSFSAIELYNPYEQTSSDSGTGLDLTPFTLDIFDPNTSTTYTFALSGTIPWGPEGFKVFALREGTASVPSGSVVLSGTGPLLQFGWEVRLTRQDAPAPRTVVEHFEITDTHFYDGSVGIGDTVAETLERAMWRVDSGDSSVEPLAFWTAVVPQIKDNSTHTLGDRNAWQGQDSSLMQIVRPVQVDFANAGSFKASLPTTGTMLLLMRHANSELDSGSGPFNMRLAEDVGGYASGQKWKASQYQIDNGRMPVFDAAGKHRLPQSLVSIEMTDRFPMGYQYLPWGQYVFDYFTALSLVPPIVDENDPEVVQGNVTPTVELIGARVYGRININAAPWPVLRGLPLVQWGTLPGSYRNVIQAFIYGIDNDEQEIPIGEHVAKAIVAYRDGRRVPGNPVTAGEESGDFSGRDPGPPDAEDPTGKEKFPPTTGGTDYATGFGELRKGSGFLGVGELANVRHWETALTNVQYGDEYTPWRIDSGVVGRRYTTGTLSGYPCEDYVQAVGLLVAMGDWATTRSNMWTIYGTLRGGRTGLRDQLMDEDDSLSAEQATKTANQAIDERAIRFEETVDRLSSVLQPSKPPRRIGQRRVGAYNDMRAD